MTKLDNLVYLKIKPSPVLKNTFDNMIMEQ